MPSASLLRLARAAFRPGYDSDESKMLWSRRLQEPTLAGTTPAETAPPERGLKRGFGFPVPAVDRCPAETAPPERGLKHQKYQVVVLCVL